MTRTVVVGAIAAAFGAGFAWAILRVPMERHRLVVSYAAMWLCFLTVGFVLVTLAIAVLTGVS